MKRKRVKGGALLIIACLFFAVLSQNAGGAFVVFQVSAISEDGNYEDERPIFTDIDWDSIRQNPGTIHQWSLSEEIEFSDGGVSLGKLEQFSISIKQDPQVSLGFVVTAGQVNTSYSFSSGPLTFDPIVNPDAKATAQISVQDNSGDGVTLNGKFADGESYQARYNDTPVVWAKLINSVSSSDSYGGERKTESKPLSGGMEVINDTLTSIETQYNFTLTANDQASGTSNFIVIPEPATIALLGLGVFGIFRRKR